MGSIARLVAESVDRTALAFEGVDHVQSGYGLSAGVLCVGDSVPDDVLNEGLDDAAGLFVDEAGDTLDASPAGQPTDGGLGDALDGVLEHLAEPFGSSLAEPLTSLSSADGHVSVGVVLGFFRSTGLERWR